MEQQLNLNIILCEKYENDSVINICNRIKTNPEHKADFTIVTFWNCVGNLTCGEFGAHYYITQMSKEEKGKSLYVGSIFGDFVEKGVDNMLTKIKLQNVPFISDGEHRLEVYYDDKAEGRGKSFEECKQMLAEGKEKYKMISTYSFDVVY